MKTKTVCLIPQVTPCRADSKLDEVLNPAAEDSEVHAETPVSDERRTFLGFLTGFIGVSISGLLASIFARFTIAPAFVATDASEWIDVANLEEIPEGKPVRRSLIVSQNAGWGRFRSEQAIWIVKKDQSLTTFSSACPHLGCTINENEKGFGCVCHNSAWNNGGEKLSGPAPRSMDTLEHKVEENVLKVKYQAFKQGLAEKIVSS